MTPIGGSTRLFSAAIVLTAALQFTIPIANGAPYTFKGAVLAATRPAGDAVGAPNLTVSLTAPVKLNKPKQVTATNEQGEFTFNNVEEGDYLLEVHQRLTILYREVVNIPQTLEKKIDLNPDIKGLVSEVDLIDPNAQLRPLTTTSFDDLVSQIDANDAKTRLKPVNTLAFDQHYSTNDVVNAVLERLESESLKPLSVQGEINCLIILARRSADPWTRDQISRAKNILTGFQHKELTKPEQYAVTQLSQALNHLRVR